MQLRTMCMDLKILSIIIMHLNNNDNFKSENEKEELFINVVLLEIKK